MRTGQRVGWWGAGAPLSRPQREGVVVRIGNIRTEVLFDGAAEPELCRNDGLRSMAEWRREIRASQPRLGPTQANLLRRMRSSEDMATWYPGCNWYWVNTSTTQRIMNGLAAKGLLERTEETVTRHGARKETVTVYRLASAGRDYDFDVEEDSQ